MIEAIRNKSQQVTIILFFILLGSLIYINSPFIVPFIISGIFALGLDNFITRTTEKLKKPRWMIVLAVLFIGFALFWVPLTVAIYRLVNILQIPENLNTHQISQELLTLKDHTMDLVRQFSASTGADITGPFKEALEVLVKKVGDLLILFSSYVIRSAPSMLFNALLFCIFFMTFSLKSEGLKSFVKRYSVLKEPITEKIIQSMKESCSITLFTTFVIGVVQAGLVILGSLIFDEGDFWLIMPLTFILAFIPVIGAGPVGFLLSLLAFIGGRTGSAIGMLIFSIISSTIDNFLKPLLIGGKDLKLSPVFTFTCAVGAIFTLGIPGVLLGPVILNIFTRVAPILVAEYNSSTANTQQQAIEGEGHT